MFRFITRVFGALLASVLIAPAAAHAAQINGDPLTVAASDEDGKLGVTFTGSGLTEFFGSSVDPSTGLLRPANSAGFVVVTVDPQGGSDRYGSRRANVTPTSAPVVTGTGTAGDPFKIVQTFHGGNPAQIDIRQEITYVNGQTEFQARLTATNISGQPLTIRTAMGADLAGGGNDRGTGLLEAGPPRFVAGLNGTVGAVAGLAEITPWSHFEEGQYSGVLSRADSNPSGTSASHLADTVDPNEVDNGAAVQWDHGTIGNGESVNVEVAWRFRRTFGLTPETQARNTGETAQFTASTADVSGNARSGTKIRWTVFGSNTAAGDATTGPDGTAAFEYVGGNPGTDRVTVYADVNDNNVRDEGEPQREATVEWTGPDAPVFAQEVNVRPVSGRVLVRLPRNAKVKGKWAQAAQARFVRLTDARQIPVGAEMDVKRGQVALTSSKDQSGTGVQTANFYSGRFIATQPARERGLTEIRMTEPLKCTSSKRRGKVIASAVRSRKLWGKGKGRFRTRGRHSSATVRGTTWLQKDTCTKTTTTVREGVVIVKDFAKRKNVRVKAGKRYVARQRKR